MNNQSINNKKPPLLLLTFLSLLPYLVIPSSGSPIEAYQWTAISIIPLILLLYLQTTKNYNSFTSTPNKTILLIFILISLQSLFNYQSPGVISGLIYISGLFAIFILSFEIKNETRWPKEIPRYSTYAAVPIAALGITQYYSLDIPRLHETFSVASVFINKNYAATYMDIMIPFAFITLIRSKTNKRLFISSLIFTFLLYYSLILGSRGGLLSLAASGIIFVFVLNINKEIKNNISEKNQRIAALSILIPVLIAFPGHIYILDDPTITSKLGGNDSSDNVTDRFEYYINTINSVTERPFTGYGTNSYFSVSQGLMANPLVITHASVLTIIPHPHNQYINLLFSFGIILGGLFISLILLIFYYNIKRKAPSERHENIKIDTLPYLMALGGLLAHSLVDEPLYHPASASLFFFILGQLTPIGIKQQRKIKRKINSIISIPLLLALLLINLIHGYGKIRGTITMDQARMSLSKGECDIAIQQVNDAISYSFSDYYIFGMLLFTTSMCERNSDKRIFAANRILGISPDYLQALLMRANAFYENGDYEKSISDYEKLIDLLPHRPTGYLGVANSKYRLGETQLATQYYKLTKSINQGEYGAWRRTFEINRLLEFSKTVTDQ